MTSNTERISIRLPLEQLEVLDFLVEVNDFPSRSEAIREAVRDLVYKRLHEVDVMAKVRKMEEARGALVQIRALREEFLQK